MIYLSAIVSAIVSAFIVTITSAQDISPKNQTFRAVPFTDVKLQDKFWTGRLETNRVVSIPHNFKWCEETGRFDNFAKAAGLMEGEFRGIYFNDSDVYKLLEGTAYSLKAHPDPELEKLADKVIDWIAAAQQENGYINSYYTLKEPDKKWTNTRNMHELYCLGHMTEAAVAYYQATGKKTLLDVTEKALAHVADTFGYEEGKKREVPGHEEIELALIKLYELTGNKKYLDMSKFFIDIRGDQSKRTDRLQGHYSQDHIPVRQQSEVTGHAVRAMYLYAGMTDIAAHTGDKELTAAVDRLWESVVGKKMYITGGIGARHEGEAFGDDYEMPNDTAYCETCAQIGLVLWAHRMNLLHGGQEYADVVERELYNGVLSGYSLKGDEFFYPNPLSTRGGYGRQPFFDCACCPTNVVRFIPSIPGYMYATKDNAIIVNQYAGSEATIELPDGTVTIKQETNYPWDGKIKLTMNSKPKNAAAKAFSLKLRIPGWQNPDNSAGSRNGYGVDPIDVEWGQEFVQNLNLPMPVKRIVANPNIQANRGRVALQRGPIVYCFEQCDNPNVDLAKLILAKEQDYKVEWKPDLFGGVNVIKCQDINGKEVTAIPYYAWAHRELTGMDVWVRQDGLSRRPKTDLPIWQDKLYRELTPMMLGDSEPLTLYDLTTVTSSHHLAKDVPNAVFDELEPKNSDDHTIPRLTWWDHKGTDEWVELTFDTPQKLSSVGIYWFDDEARNGGCRVPASWSLSYKDGDKWLPVKTSNQYETAKDRYNNIAFEDIETTALRFDVKLQEKFSGGVLEIKVK